MKEFNLSDKREELVQVLREKFGIHNSMAWSIMKRVIEQDKEFISKLKEGIDNRIISNTANEIVKEEINQLTGEELSK